MSNSGGLAGIDHIVLLMLENRSFDHMLGYLYSDRGNTSPTGQDFDGLTGQESCPGTDGTPVPVYRITPTTPNAYLLPGADPGEGFAATNTQLFGTATPTAGATPDNKGFVSDYAAAIADNRAKGWYVVPGTTPEMIMACHTPETLPVLSALARGYAVCDRWFCSVPTMTMPNRAFTCAATSLGRMNDRNKFYPTPSIFGSLTTHHIPWKIYGYNTSPLARLDFPDTKAAPAAQYGLFTDFQTDAANGQLPAFCLLEPSWGPDGNSQHPNYDVARGEQLLLGTYRALHGGRSWDRTLLIITYDEHGGCYDHVPPPSHATPPDASHGQFGFDFTRYGLRVPTVLVSPLIPAGTVFRAPPAGPPLDHTSILATVQHRWSLPPLTARDAGAPDIGAALSLPTARTDDPLSVVTAPAATPLPATLTDQPSHLQKVHAALAADLPIPDRPDLVAPPVLHTSADYTHYIDQRVHDWETTTRTP